MMTPTRHPLRKTIAVVLALLAAGLCAATTSVAQPGAPPDEEDVQVLARGPVHEAFAETVAYDPEPGITVSRGPPANIEELPPEQQPEGTNVAWIPGYWAWDDDSTDFLWVSGVWRVLPPGRQWIPGYWAAAGKQAQWTSGYWADAQNTEAEYLPEPPASVETGPTVASASADDVWIPGHWVWQQNRYAWRSGIWSQGQPNWIWVPAHYLWAPRGYIYVDGYWDHSVARRGILFAPVRFHQRLLSQRGYSYTPSTVIDPGVFANHLFLRPSYGHYYYGDYYGSNYASSGFYPWYTFNSGRRGYDPFYAHQRWHHRRDGNWERQLESDFQLRRSNEGFRPPHTFAAQQALARQGLTAQNRTRVFTQPLEQYTQARDVAVRLQPINPEDRQQYNRLGKAAQAYREERLRRETQVIEVPPSAKRVTAVEPARLKLPRSPYVAKQPQELGKEFAPPKAYEFPKPDPRIVPQPRIRVGQKGPAEPRAESAPRSAARPAAAEPEPKSAPDAPPRGRPDNKPERESKGKPKS